MATGCEGWEVAGVRHGAVQRRAGLIFRLVSGLGIFVDVQSADRLVHGREHVGPVLGEDGVQNAR